ncbi:MAG TPA: cytochrome c3 family protein [Terriglobales bacterium]|nr:cytochrome c3 family protein [Terriglobales bacterium]
MGLWSQKLSTVQNYTLYPQSEITNVVEQPVLGDKSNICLSCHDGTVAPGQTTPWGKIQMSGSMTSQDVLGQDLSTVHPFNFKLPLQMPVDQNLIPSIVNSGVTANPAVQMPGGNVQCTSCHNPHVQSIDTSNAFLVMDNTSSALCLACHISTLDAGSTRAAKRVSPSEVQAGTSSSSLTEETYNGLTAWRTSVHAEAGQQAAKAANVGPYGTVRKNGCMSCHTMHNAQAGGALLSPAKQLLPNVDASTQNCLNCHNGGSTISPAIMNIYQEFTKKGHPFPSGKNSHTMNESTLLNKNRHATCADCHDPHSSQKTSSFLSITIRPAESGANGISAENGATVVSPAVNQYEVCFRCHATSTGKQTLAIYGYLPTRVNTTGDPLNLVPQFSRNSISSHPVTHDRLSKYAQPSLLKFMWNLDGHTQGRIVGSRILCTDCHNSDDNREFGGQGPNGPHGSQYDHILERQYEYSEVSSAAGPGTAIENLLPVVVNPGADGPYSLCAKCHDLSNILSNASFSKHSIHINAGFSCSVCHTAHGVPNSSAGMAGERLVSFDVRVVARNDATEAPISYNQSTGTCTLKCHNYNHNQNGTVTTSRGKTPSPGPPPGLWKH